MQKANWEGLLYYQAINTVFLNAVLPSAIMESLK